MRRRGVRRRSVWDYVSLAVVTFVSGLGLSQIMAENLALGIGLLIVLAGALTALFISERKASG